MGDKFAVCTIESDCLKLSFLPDLGGSIRYFAASVNAEWVELMRSTPESVASSSETSNFLMAPYPNRIREGRFSFKGNSYQLRYPEKHAIHGDVRNRSWQIEKQAASSCQLRFESKWYPDINFPFPFLATVNYELIGATFKTEVAITNCGDREMPVGSGYHPYFPLALRGTSGPVELQFRARGVYPTAEGVPLPTAAVLSQPPQYDFSSSRQLESGFDHCFGGWHGPLIISWPRSGVTLKMLASDNTKHLVLYSPPGKDFFAIEPQTQMIDGVNFLEHDIETGVQILKPGETFRMWYTLETLSTPVS